MSPFTIAQFFAMGQSPEQMAWLPLLLGITWPTTHGAVAVVVDVVATVAGHSEFHISISLNPTELSDAESWWAASVNWIFSVVTASNVKIFVKLLPASPDPNPGADGLLTGVHAPFAQYEMPMSPTGCELGS
jgi:hypothetical protein